MASDEALIFIISHPEYRPAAHVVPLRGRDERRGVAAPAHNAKKAAEGRRRTAANRRQGEETRTDLGVNFRWNTAPRLRLVEVPLAG
jgi:hypothetical protein